MASYRVKNIQSNRVDHIVNHDMQNIRPINISSSSTRRYLEMEEHTNEK